jgi:hypothetical protein
MVNNLILQFKNDNGRVGFEVAIFTLAPVCFDFGEDFLDHRHPDLENSHTEGRGDCGYCVLESAVPHPVLCY